MELTLPRPPRELRGCNRHGKSTDCFELWAVLGLCWKVGVQEHSRRP